MHARILIVLSLFASAGLTGCTPSQYADQADEDALAVLDQGQRAVYGRERRFDIDYDPVWLSRRDQPTVIRVGEKVIRRSGEPVELTLDEALEVAFRSSRSYQTRKEELFSSALAVANTRRAWNWTLLGGSLDAEASHTQIAKGDGTDSGTGEVGPTLTKRFLHGGQLTLATVLDLATDFVGGSDTTIGGLVNANFTQPLLQGAWRGLAYEQQYRRERDFLFAVFEYQRFRQELAASIVSDYYNVVRARDELENERATIERLRQALKLTTVLVANGEATVVDQDQAIQSLLSAQIRFQGSRQDYQDAIDRLKLTLGLPIWAEVVPAYEETLARLLEGDPKPMPLKEEDAIALALRTRPDVLVERAQARDAARNVEIAADEFLPQLDLVLDASATGTERREFYRIRWDKHTRSAKLTLQYDLDQTDNRDAYRLALIERDRARRELTEFLDTVRLDVRQQYRTLVRTYRNYRIQQQRVEVARRGRKLALLKQKEGEASTRDVLDAEERLREAQNGLTSEIVRYKSTRLRFLATLGLLAVDDDGQLQEQEHPSDFQRIVERYPYLGTD